MAKRNGGEALKEEEKRSLNKGNLQKLVGIFKFMLAYRGNFIIGLIALALSTLTLLAFPYLAGQLIDVALKKSRYFTSINQVTLALFVVLIVQSLFSFIRVYTF